MPVLRDDHEAAGSPVQAADRPVHKILRTTGMAENGVLQGILRLPEAALAGHARGLVHNQQEFILPGDAERHGPGRREIERTGFRQEDLYPVAGSDADIHADALPVQQDLSVPLGAFHGGVTDLHGPAQDFPQAAALLLRANDPALHGVSLLSGGNYTRFFREKRTKRRAKYVTAGRNACIMSLFQESKFPGFFRGGREGLL